MSSMRDEYPVREGSGAGGGGGVELRGNFGVLQLLATLPIMT